MTDDFIAEFERLRPSLIAKAISDTMKWCVLPETAVGSKRSDQFWMQEFAPGAGPVQECTAHRFLVTFQLTNRVRWDKAAVVGVIEYVRRASYEDAPKAVAQVAMKLRDCILSANRGRQTSAASKLSMFAKPDRPIFIWDQLATRSARLRDCLREETPVIPGGLRKLYKVGDEHDYQSYSTACAAALHEERTRPDFCSAVNDVASFLAGEGGANGQRAERFLRPPHLGQADVLGGGVD